MPLSSMIDIVQQLPQLMFYSQIVFYVIFILFFGSISVKFYRSYLNWALKLLLRIATGLVCLVAAVPLSGLLPSYSGLLGLLQIDVILAGIIISIIIGIGLLLITYGRENIQHIEKLIEKLQERRSKAKASNGINIKMIIGLALIAGVLVYTLVAFQGLPNVNEDFYSMIGMSESEFQNIVSMTNEGSNIQSAASQCVVEGEFIKCPISAIRQ